MIGMGFSLLAQTRQIRLCEVHQVFWREARVGKRERVLVRGSGWMSGSILVSGSELMCGSVSVSGSVLVSGSHWVNGSIWKRAVIGERVRVASGAGWSVDGVVWFIIDRIRLIIVPKKIMTIHRGPVLNTRHAAFFRFGFRFPVRGRLPFRSYSNNKSLLVVTGDEFSSGICGSSRRHREYIEKGSEIRVL